MGRRRICFTGRRRPLTTIAAHRSDLAPSADAVGERLIVLEDAFRAMAMAMEFGFLFDKERQLLSIGYLNSESALDPNCYDLLASEARLASFFAIAKGDIPARHWFRLGRAATAVSRGAALISWSGSMFEYLMPPLVMRAPARQFAGTDRSTRRAPSDRIWREARVAMGDFRIRLQCARSGIHLSIFELRRTRPRPETRIGRKPSCSAVCDGPGGHGRPFSRRRKSEATDRDGRAGSLRILRGGGFHADARSGGRELRARSLVHGAPPGHDHRRDRQRIVRRRDARALSCRTDHSGDGIVVAGARSARGRLDCDLGPPRSSRPPAPARPIPPAGARSPLRISPSPRRCCSPTVATP